MKSTIARGKSDKSIKAIRQALAKYEDKHKKARTSIYRYSSASIRIRIIDPSFTGTGRAERHDYVWTYVENLPEDVVTQITMLLLLTPKEVKSSFANEEFDHPTPMGDL